jgi:hypothetical protein
LSDLGQISIIKGELRFKGSNDVDFRLQIPLVNTIKEYDETDKNLTLNLQQLFDTERNECTIFRPTCKFSWLFSNSYSGLTVGNTTSTPYKPFNNQLFYTDTLTYKQLQLTAGNGVSNQISWAGYPQYNEFSLIRNDLNVDGYTKMGSNRPHLYGSDNLAPYYNWYIHLSYSYSSTTAQTMQCVMSDGSTYSWICSEGIPYYLNKTFLNGRPILQFTCPMSHNLSVGEYVKLSNTCNGITNFQVYSIGNGLSGSEKFIFNVYNVGYNCVILENGSIGTFKRVIDEDIQGVSKYYIRKHKILTNFTDAIITKSGFEKNGLKVVKKFESKQLTPNLVSRVSIKEDSQSYNISFLKDIDINGLLDNLKRPITELYFTVINRGYFGWFNKPIENTNTALKKGWEFNLGPQLNSWWNISNVNSNTQIQVSSYASSVPEYNNKIFYYNSNLNIGDEIDGDFCEWNDLEQSETVISEHYHKITFNSDVFNIGTTTTNPLGYYYKPHNSMTIKVFSNYVEESDGQVINDLPNYAFFKKSTQEYVWRDIYTYGFIDNEDRGVDYPYLNNSHYPHTNLQFRIIPEGTNLATGTTSNIIITDNCE